MRVIIATDESGRPPLVSVDAEVKPKEALEVAKAYKEIRNELDKKEESH